MTKFLERMREELVRRNYAESTIRSYLRKRRDMKEDLPYPRNYRRRLPVILSFGRGEPGD